MYEMIEVVNEILPKDKPLYLMGGGTPLNILEGRELGVDMFDCVMQMCIRDRDIVVAI